MTRLITAPAFICLLCSFLSVTRSQAESNDPSGKKPEATEGRNAGVPDKTLMQEINDAWATLEPDSAARYYDGSSGNVFYDIAPLKYVGWQAYARGARETLKTLWSMRYAVGDDAVVHVAGSFAWGTATLHLETVGKDGRVQAMDLRWTPVWEKKGDQWLIVHEHLSAPLGPVD